MRPLAAAALLLLCACSDTTDTCEDRPVDVQDICIPSSISPGLPIAVDVRELCGSGCSGPPSCSALLRNSTVILDVSGSFCTSYLSATCLDMPCVQCITRWAPAATR